MFWGITIENGKRYSQVVDSSFHVSMAALEQSEDLHTKKPNVNLIIEHEKSEFLLCTLEHGKSYQQPLDLNFAEGEEVTFFLNGEGVVHLTGYLNGGDQEGFEEFDSDVDSDLNLDNLEDEDEKNEQDTGKNNKRKMHAKALVNAKRKKLDSSDEDLSDGDESDDEEEDDDDDEEDEDDDSDVEKFLKRQAPVAKQKSKLQKATPAKQLPETKQGKKPQATPSPKSPVTPNKSSGNSTLDSSMNSEKKKRKRKKKSKTPTLADNQKAPLQNSNTPAKNADNKTPAKNGNVTTPAKNVGSKTPVKHDGVKTPAKVSRQVLPSGVIVEDLHVGSGPEAKPGKFIQVYYAGQLQNKKEFDSVTSGKPFKFKLGKGEVIKGWDEGIKGMKVGGKRKVIVPPEQAYGKKAVGPIPPNSTLTFDITLKAVQ